MRGAISRSAQLPDVASLQPPRISAVEYYFRHAALSASSVTSRKLVTVSRNPVRRQNLCEFDRDIRARAGKRAWRGRLLALNFIIRRKHKPVIIDTQIRTHARTPHSECRNTRKVQLVANMPTIQLNLYFFFFFLLFHNDKPVLII